MSATGGCAGGGDGGGAAFATVTVTGDETALLPAASRATAVKLCVPLAVPALSQLIE